MLLFRTAVFDFWRKREKIVSIDSINHLSTGTDEADQERVVDVKRSATALSCDAK